MSNWNKFFGVVVIIAIILALGLAISVLVACWGPVVQVAGTKGFTLPDIKIFALSWARPNTDALYLVIVLAMGAIGSCIHALTSAASYLGNNEFYKRWIPWYVVRVPVGMGLALILYVAIRGGLLTTGTATAAINPYGIAAIAGLAGLFSKQATDKLDEVFKTLFQTQEGGDAARANKLTKPKPKPKNPSNS